MKKKIIFTIIVILVISFIVMISFFDKKEVPVFSNTSFVDSGNKASFMNTSGNSNLDTIENEEILNTFTSSFNFDTIKAVYSSGWVAGGTSSRQAMIESINNYGFNAVVLDIKDEDGHLSYKSNVQTAIDISSSKNMIKDINNVIKEYHENGIYVIGRIVTFKDPTYAKAVKEIAFQKDDGSFWTDRNGNFWPNPYNKESWNYPIALAKEAIELGFDEIQFDYIRFPSSEGKVKQIAFGFDSETVSKSEIINMFLKTVMDELSDYNVKISADVFGITTKRDGDFENIGQDYKAIANIVDVICPMVYPSHYAKGEYKVAKPDLEPYTIINRSLLDAFERTSGETNTAIIRPYLQDFNASWLGKGNYQKYENEAVSEQIKACNELGINTFTLWDPTNKYCYEALSIALKSGE